MKPEKKYAFTDEHLDALLGATFEKSSTNFTDKILSQLEEVTENEIDLLLEGNVAQISENFTDRTLEKIEGDDSKVVQFPVFKWVARSGMVAAVFAAGLFSWSMLGEPEPSISEAPIAHLDFSNMSLEELLYMEESLSSAKLLIELDKTIPLHNLIETVES